MRRPLRGGGAPPFVGPDAEALAAYADGRLDLTNPAVAVNAPLAVRAILAREFGGYEAIRHMTWPEAQAALQLLAEERVGRALRAARAAEDAAATAIAAELGKH